MVKNGAFRPDLFHRMNGQTVRMPSLSDLPEAIWPAFAHFLNSEGGEQVAVADQDGVRAVLIEHEWLGNLGELQLTAQKAVAWARYDDSPVTPDIVVRSLSTDRSHLQRDTPDFSLKHLLEKALAATSGNVARAARLIGRADQTVRDWTREYDIDLSRFNSAGLPEVRGSDCGAFTDVVKRHRSTQVGSM